MNDRPESRPRPPAADDAALVRYLDGELTEHERAGLERALAADPAAAARLDALRRRSLRLRALLGEDDDAAPPARTRIGAHGGTPVPRPLLRAAIIVFALLATALLVPPVRAWIATGIARIAGDRPVARTDPPAEQAPDAAEDFAMGVALEPRGDTFAIVVDRPQNEGRLVIRHAGSDDAGTDDPAASGGEAFESAARALVYGDARDADLLVLPGALHIRNRDDARASYTVILTGDVRAVRIEVDARVRTLPLDADSIAVPLRR